MKPGTLTTVIIIIVCGACTFLERALPFLIFGSRKVPGVVRYLGKVLPMAIMATLIAYCLKSVSFGSASGWVPQAVAAVLTAVLHIWKGNAMLSIFSGTVCCMLLTRFL